MKKVRFLKSTTAWLPILFAVTIVATDRAQAEPQAGPPPVTDQTDSADIVVTAQKRSELLKDVPAAITAVTGATFQELVASKLDDYVARIPGLLVAQTGGAAGATQLSIRGINTGAGGNPTVGIYVDESPFGATTGVGGYAVPDLDPQDLKRVEVLRGPQGTLYGASSLGGLLKYVTADPDPTRFYGRIQADGSTIDGGSSGYGVRGSANIPLAETLALRVSGYNRRDPGFIDNVLTGEKNVNVNRYYGGRAALGWTLSADWKVKLSALYQHYDGAAPIVDYSSASFRPAYGDLKQSRAPGTTNVEQDIGAYSTIVEGDLGFATLTSATSYNHQRAVFPLDFTPIFGPIFGPAFGIPALGFNVVGTISVDKVTQEFRVAAPSRNRLSWQVGVFYTREKQAAANNFLPIDSLTGALIGGLPLVGSYASNSTFREIAAFGSVTYRFSDAFDLTAGLRYSKNKQRNAIESSGLFYGPSTRYDLRSEDDALTFLLNPRLHLDSNNMLYVRIASGYRPGGPNNGYPGTPLTYGPDKVVDYEIGLKSDILDRKLSLELSAFWIKWRDIQIQRVLTNGSAFIDNGAVARSRGVEASATFRPARDFEIYGNFAYTDARLTRDLPVGSASGAAGDQLPLTSPWTAAVGASYSVPLAGTWRGTAGIDYHYVGPHLGSFPNAGQLRFRSPRYDTVDLRFGVTDDRWSFTLFAKNIGDSRGQLTDVNFGAGTTSVSIIAPRTFGLSAARKF